MSNTSTPYDDAQRTLSVDCPSLLIPLVNEAFQTDYPLDADVKLYNNEFFIDLIDGNLLISPRKCL